MIHSLLVFLFYTIHFQRQKTFFFLSTQFWNGDRFSGSDRSVSGIDGSRSFLFLFPFFIFFSLQKTFSFLVNWKLNPTHPKFWLLFLFCSWWPPHQNISGTHEFHPFFFSPLSYHILILFKCAQLSSFFFFCFSFSGNFLFLFLTTTSILYLCYAMYNCPLLICSFA